MLRPFLHLSVATLYSYTLWYDQKYVLIPYPNDSWDYLPLKARVTFLTVWCLVFQTLYYIVAFLNDLFGTNEANPKKVSYIRNLKDLMFSIAYPLATFVSGAFWAFFLIDREFIFPDWMDDIMPLWVNHVAHTSVAIFINLELLYSNKNFPSRKVGFGILVTMNVIYVSFLFAVNYYTDAWPYPFLDHMNYYQIALFFVSGLFLSYYLYIGCEKLNGFVSKNTSKASVKKVIKFN